MHTNIKVDNFNTLEEKIGIKLKNLRLKNNVTLKYVASKTNISTTTLAKIEKGTLNTAYKYNYYKLICNLFNVDHIKYLNLKTMSEKTIDDVLLKIRAYMGFKSDEDLSIYLFNKKYVIAEYKQGFLTDRNSIIIVEKLLELKDT